MNRRNFLKLIATGMTPFVASLLCNLPNDILPPSATVGPTLAPQGGIPTWTVSLPSGTPSPGTVPAPHAGLGSNSNYFLYSDCNPVMGLSVTIDITKDIVSDIGFSFQLNAYSPQGANCVWQQYGFSFLTTNHAPLQARAFVDNWPSANFKQSQNLGPGNMINHKEIMLNLPGDRLPSGYQLMINLKYDQNENVVGAAYTILDNAGKSTSTEMLLESLTYADSAGRVRPVTSAALAPINSFVLNLVGPNDGKHSNLSAGAGTFTYAASSPLKVSREDPRCTSAQKTRTAETTNSVYGTLPAGPNQTITQSFDTRIPQ